MYNNFACAVFHRVLKYNSAIIIRKAQKCTQRSHSFLTVFVPCVIPNKSSLTRDPSPQCSGTLAKSSLQRRPEVCQGVTNVLLNKEWGQIGIQIFFGFVDGVRSSKAQQAQASKSINTKEYFKRKNGFAISVASSHIAHCTEGKRANQSLHTVRPRDFYAHLCSFKLCLNILMNQEVSVVYQNEMQQAPGVYDQFYPTFC